MVSTVVLRLDAPGAYPLLLGQPWLRTTNIKQHWQHNMISFRREKTKVQIVMAKRTTTPPDNCLMYAKGVHMLNGLADNEMDSFFRRAPH